MAKIAIVETKKSRNNYDSLFENAFEFDLYQLTEHADLKKVLKKDVTIEIDLDAYEWVILVGSEPLNYFTKAKSITSFTGKIVDDKFLPIINPAMIKFKPEAKKPWEDSKANIVGYISGSIKPMDFEVTNLIGIDDTEVALKYITDAISSPTPYIALDSETTALYPRDGYMIGLSLSYAKDSGAYILTDCIDDRVEEALQRLFNEKSVVFHNAKFDLGFFEYHFNFRFPNFEDTMLMHYVLDETQGSHGLKELALKYTKYGDYEKEQHEWIVQYCRANSIKKEDFTFDLIPFDIIKQYAAIDAAVTFELYELFHSYLVKNDRLNSLYKHLLIPACRFLTDVQDNGVPFSKERLIKSQVVMEAEISEAVEELHKFKEVAKMEEAEGKSFNPNSTVQLRKLLFDYIGLEPTGKLTGTGANSTDASVLEELAEIHEVPQHILSIRKSSKIKNTYLDKIIPQLDRDGRLRTGFNLHTTTSGRLSSSGKLNMQQLPRDNPTVKGCIKAKAGYKIVSMDLTTAEMYVAAVLSNDLDLQDVFRKGGNFHSQIAKKVFNLTCTPGEVEAKHKKERQAAKAVSFGILYGAGSAKIAESVGISKARAEQVIKDYFNTFWKLKEWLEETKEAIEGQGFIYNSFGRKRRLPNVKSIDKETRGHEIRSGVNFVIQSVASDINLLGGIDMHNWLKTSNLDAKIFALVHDSVLAEVKEEDVEEYITNLRNFIQKDRGCSIVGVPIGCDFEVGDDYSFGKYERLYESDNV